MESATDRKVIFSEVMAKVFLSELQTFAREAAGRISARAFATRAQAFVVYLSGDLGSGKTTFMQAFARELGVEATLKSPTFVLMKNYAISWSGFTRLVHIDAYRLQKAEEFEALKPKTFLNDPHALVCVEWPEQINDALPKPDMYLKFKAGEETGARDIELIERQ